MNYTFHNAVEIIETEDGVYAARLPVAMEPHLNPNAQMRMYWSGGCELRFVPRAWPVRVTLSKADEGPALLTVYHGAFMRSEQHVIGPDRVTIEITPPEKMAHLIDIARRDGHPFDPELVRVMLPWRGTTMIHSVEGDIEPPRPDQTPSTRYLAYGSSISQGNLALRPDGMYVARTAQRLGVDLFNLGFGGGAHLEPEVADFIASRDDWDFATLEMGINMLGGYSAEAFDARAHYFAAAVAATGRRVFVLDLLPFVNDADPAKVESFRQSVRDAVAAAGQPNMVYVDAQPLLPDMTGLTTDLVHPSPAGMETIAANLAAVMRDMI